MNWGATIEKLREGATQLIITTKVTLVDLDEAKLQSVEYKDGITGETATAKTEAHEAIEVKKIIMDKIIVDLR
ncbi:MAG: hypothetical protein RR844_06570 [Clostridium sp.]